MIDLIEARKALEPFAKLFDLILDEPKDIFPDDCPVFKSKAGRAVTYGDFRYARSVFKTLEERY